MRYPILITLYCATNLACTHPPADTDAGAGHDAAGPAVSGSCGMSAAHVCVDHVDTGPALDTYRSSCMAGGNSWSDAPCTHAMSLGGCRYDASSASGAGTVWAYPGSYADAAAARTGCETGTPPGTYVAP